VLVAAMALAQSSGLNLDHPAIQYTTRPTRDAVSELSRKIDSGKLELRYDSTRGYLPAILEALAIPVQSQMLVLSKTSVQSMRIGPQTPRAVYFNDSVAVGWVPRGTIEIAALDPQQGMIFYSVDQRKWVHETGAALFQRRTDCLHCHVAPATMGVPGALLRSVQTTPDGTPLRMPPGLDTDLRTPFEKLWAGWYVSGESGAAHHQGKPASGFPAELYPSPYSDIVALLVFEHQTRMMNLLTAAGWQARIASPGLRDAVKDLVDYLLFVEEPPLPAKIQGASGFAEKFAAQGFADSRGRSLRQFDLEHRLMRYPCSYMIYSEAFDTLPGEVKNLVYQRIWEILAPKTGVKEEAKYARIAPADRLAVLEILRETKPGLPAYYTAARDVRK
jgi:hypothetical protein